MSPPSTSLPGRRAIVDESGIREEALEPDRRARCNLRRALAGSLNPTSTAAADRAGRSAARGQQGGITSYAYRANTFGTKVVVNGVELKTVKDAQALQKCTRQLRGEIVKGSSLGTDGLLPIGNDLIKISPSTSRTETYHSGSRYGVRGTNLIADIAVGGEVGGIQTPVLKIQGLESTADSFVDAGASRGGDHFGYASDFGFKGISLEIPQAAQLPPEVQQLLQIVNQAATPINQVVNQVVQLLTQVGGTTKIPGLGSLGLGTSTAGHRAQRRVERLRAEDPGQQPRRRAPRPWWSSAGRQPDQRPGAVGCLPHHDVRAQRRPGRSAVLRWRGPASIPCEGTGGNAGPRRSPPRRSRDS